MDIKPFLLPLIPQLPKVSLHDHLDGGLRPETMLELAQEIGYQLPASEPEELAAWFKQAADSRSLDSYLETFSHTVALMQTAQALRRVAKEHVQALAEDGVIYGEVRWAPEQHLTQGLSMSDAVEAVAQGLMEGMQAVAEEGKQVLVTQILCALRHQDNSLEVVETALAFRLRGVVGFDLAGPEAGFEPSRHARALDLAARHFLPITLHAGEAAGLESIRQALHEGRALRLGHGVRLAEDMTLSKIGDIDPEGTLMPGADPQEEILQLGEVAEWVKNRRIVLEMCPCSNLQTDAAPQAERVGREGDFAPARLYAEHPLPLFQRAGFAVTVNPDNRLMSATSMTREFTLLAEEHGFGLNNFFDLTAHAVDGSFASLDEKQAMMRHIQEAYGYFSQQLDFKIQMAQVAEQQAAAEAQGEGAEAGSEGQQADAPADAQPQPEETA